MNAQATLALDPSRRLLRAAGAVAILLGWALVYSLVPMHGFGAACPFHALTGLDCFGCGLTRSLLFAVHGDIVTAMRFHVMGPIILGLAIGVSLTWIREAASANGTALLKNRSVRLWLVSGFAAVWILYGSIRLLVEATGLRLVLPG